MIGRGFAPWSVRSGGQERGPFDTGQLLQLLANGQVSWSSDVWREGMRAWTPVARLFTIPELTGGRLELRDLGQGDGTYRVVAHARNA